jgi:AMIN domain
MGSIKRIQYGDRRVDRNTLTIFKMKNMPILPLACILALLLGCSSHWVAAGPSPNARSIVDLVINENATSLILTIKGNGPLVYTASMPAAPNVILIQFPDTGLKLSRNRFQPPENEFISVIKAGEIDENNKTTSNILIGLKKEAPYDLVSVEAGLQVIFPKSPNLSGSAKMQQETADTEPQPKSINQHMPVATILTKISSKSLTDSFVVDVEADGAIKNYKTFTMKDPARIVFDFYQVKCAQRNEQRVAVQSKWVKRIRYFGHPDKLRLVIETYNDYTSKYSAVPTDTGLKIYIGKTN